MIGRQSVVSTAMSSHVVGAEAAGVTVFVLLAAMGLPGGWCTMLGLVVVAAALVPVRGRPPAWWLSAAVGRRLGSPTDHSRVTSLRFENGRSIGVRWDGRHLSGTMEISPLSSGTSVIERGESLPDTRVPLEALIATLAHHDLRPVSVDVSTHGRRLGTDTNAADTYHRLIGPLPAVATRSAFVTVSVDTRRSSAAVMRRGGGFAGAANTITVALGRVERALTGTGLGPRILTASELSAVARYFSAGVRSGGTRRVRGWSLRPHRLGESLEQVWSTPCDATTVTVKLRHSDVPGHVRAAVLYSVTADEVPDRPPASGSIPLRGNHIRLLRAQEPSSTGMDDALSPAQQVETSAVTALTIPVSGCGQLIGSDVGGRAVAARVWGQGTSTVHVRGELFLARQLVFRAIAVGARVLLSTERPADWMHLAAAMTDRRSLTITGPSERLPAVASHGYDLVVVDGHSSRPPSPSSTTMYVLDTFDSEMPDSPDISIVQPNCRGEDVVVTSRSGTEVLTLVTVAQETEFTGRPRLTVGAQPG